MDHSAIIKNTKKQQYKGKHSAAFCAHQEMTHFQKKTPLKKRENSLLVYTEHCKHAKEKNNTSHMKPNFSAALCLCDLVQQLSLGEGLNGVRSSDAADSRIQQLPHVHKHQTMAGDL